jgi:hypothetical protein
MKQWFEETVRTQDKDALSAAVSHKKFQDFITNMKYPKQF